MRRQNMDNDFFNQLNKNCKSKEELNKEIEKKRKDEYRKTQQEIDDAISDYHNFILSFIEQFKKASVSAVSKGMYIETNNRKKLKGKISLYSESETDYYDTRYCNKSLFMTFFNPIIQNAFLGSKIEWEENTCLAGGGITLYKRMPDNYHGSPYNQTLKSKCDSILTDIFFLQELHNLVPTIKFGRIKRSYSSIVCDSMKFSFDF